MLHKGVHLPGTGTAANFVNKVMQNLSTVFGMQHFRVELHTVQAAGGILCSGNRAVGGVGNNIKAGGSLLDIVIMAHPANILVRQAVKQRAGGIQIHNRLAIFAFRSLANLTAQHMHHQLTAIADAQYRNTPSIYFGIDGRGIRQVSAVGTTGKDNALWIFGLDFGQVSTVRINFAINVAFTDTAGDQLVILATKVQHNDSFLLHVVAPSQTSKFAYITAYTDIIP